MNKKLATLLVCVVVLGGLLGFYAYSVTRPAEEGDEEEETLINTYSFVDYDKSAMTELKVTWNGTELAFEQDEEGWDAAEASVYLNASSVSTLASSFCGLYASETLDISSEDYAEYGLESPALTLWGKSAEGVEEVFYIGSATAGKDYYYVLHGGEDNVYLIRKATVDKFMVTYNDLVDKNTAELTVDYISYAMFAMDGETRFEMVYADLSEDEMSLLASYGYAGQLVTAEPLDGREVYTSNLGTLVIDYVNGIALGDLVDLEIDYEKYGLDNPSCELIFEETTPSGDADTEDTVVRYALTVGADADEEGTTAYCVYEGNPHVYTIDKSALTNIYACNIFKLFDKFVSLVSINTVDYVEVKYPDETFRFNLSYTLTESDEEGAEPTEELTGVAVNGEEVDLEGFKDLYQAIIGISYEDIVDAHTPSGDPAMTLTFALKDGSRTVDYYYAYDNNFYSILKQGESDTNMIVSKQMSDVVKTYIGKLLAGELG